MFAVFVVGLLLSLLE